MHVRKSVNVENGTCKHATGGGWTCCFQHEKHQQAFLIWINGFDFKLHGRSSWSHKRELKIVSGGNLLVLLLCPYYFTLPLFPFTFLYPVIITGCFDSIYPLLLTLSAFLPILLWLQYNNNSIIINHHHNHNHPLKTHNLRSASVVRIPSRKDRWSHSVMLSFISIGKYWVVVLM